MVLGSSRAKALGIAPQHLSISPLAHDPSYSKIEVHSECYWGSVCLITSVFEQGGITVLVGTKSLLGEGWDAPCINTLVLASFVDSFMLSNQMRGRAIRVDSTQPRKTANIWHLVCAEPGIFGPGDDYDLLVRRCAAFVGVSAAAPVIEKGTEEQSIFLRALRETLSPIDNPRYLLARRKIWRLFREDYFAVPDVLARKKEFAEFFAQRWKRLVGPVQLVFTRTPEGRRLLLRARNYSLS